MQKARFTQYAAVGVQELPGMRLNVRSNVRLPDSEAGSGQEMAMEPYRATRPVCRRRRRSVTVPAWFAAIFLTAVFLLFGGLIIGRLYQRVQIVQSIETMEQEIAETRKDNDDKKVLVAKARDRVRIGFEAVQKYGMVASTAVETIQVVAPMTRPVQPADFNAAAQEDSPLSAPDGIMTGSR